jgi:hypothetical protein
MLIILKAMHENTFKGQEAVIEESVRREAPKRR